MLRSFFGHLLGLSDRPTRTVSATLAAQIAAFRAAEAVLASIDEDADPAGWQAAAAAETEALRRLLAQRPANIQEFAAKFSAVIRATATDTEFHILRTLEADLRALAEGGAR